jgi:hypothetical protein
MKPVIIKRSTKKRKINRSLKSNIAAEAIGDIDTGCEIFGLTGGQFSLVDLITYCLEKTGPADVIISTWTAANADIGFAHTMLSDGRIKSLRFVIDASFPVRQPIYCAALRERFGDKSIRITRSHFKFVLITNEKWSLVIRTSMNLNLNRRLESFEISDDSELSGHLIEFIDELFSNFDDSEQFKNSSYINHTDFENMSSSSVLSEDPLGVNIEKCGISTRKGLLK